MLNFIKDYICSNANWASMTLFRKQYAHATIACIPVVPLSLGLRVSGLSPAKNLGSSIAGHDRLRLRFRREWKVEEKTFMLPVFDKPTHGGLSFYLIMDYMAGGIKRK